MMRALDTITNMQFAEEMGLSKNMATRIFKRLGALHEGRGVWIISRSFLENIYKPQEQASKLRGNQANHLCWNMARNSFETHMIRDGHNKNLVHSISRRVFAN